MQDYFIAAGIRSNSDTASEEYTKEYNLAYNLISLYCFLFELFGTIEFLIMFTGATMFSNRANLFIIIVHVFGEFSLL